ncbi:glycerol kinase 5 [Leptinotarsa decemlineata]|uniref:glycerol kinase 5 n=1 Tax=Leptinotarsa decemlineata TaxID=7539 RepID=UPI003D30C7B5
MSGDSRGFVLSLDVGTTTLSCHLFNSACASVASSSQYVRLLYPKPGWVEINPDELFSDVLEVVNQTIKKANVSIADIKSFGIATQRATFITWKKDTGEPLHNFITWKDLRAAEFLKDLNSSWPTVMLRWSCYFLYLFTRIKKFGVGGKFKIECKHVTGRLLWIIANISEVSKALESDNLMFGTMDTWLIYKLTGGKTYVSDISNASCTGFYDPFDLGYGILAKLLKIPVNILPKVVDNDYEFGSTLKDFFGMPLRIGCVMGDQSSSMFGTCSFKTNDVKVTLGTGSFLNINTSGKLHPSLNGIYPIVGWKIKNEITFISEVSCNDAGSLIQWLLLNGFVQSPSETSEIASKVEDSNGVYFVPAFSGLGPPIGDEKAATGFIGITPTTKNAHMIRAVLESIVYQLVLAFELLKKERVGIYRSLRIDGGVSQNDFICQMLADLADISVERSGFADMTVRGVAYIAGLSSGVWKDETEFQVNSDLKRVFKPTTSLNEKEKYKTSFKQWILAVERFKFWYKM